jgi:hypothetical protein
MLGSLRHERADEDAAASFATIHVAPIVETNKAFVEWWATFDCAAGEYDRWTNHFEKEGFARWLAALRRFMETEGR